jgi:pimeloyl-ACP methyl ester carboxylesterase
MIAPDGTVYEFSGDGPVVVLVHGLGLERHMWQWLLPDLSEFQVLTYDLLGHGESPNPDGVVDLRAFSEQIVSLIDHCGIARCAIAGFSLGGMIARRFAIDHGERLTALAILNSVHDRTPEERAAIMKRVEQSRRFGPAATVEAALERWFTAPFCSTNPGIIDQVRRWVLANRPKIYPEIYRVLAEGDAELAEPIRDIRCPTLLMTGEEDFGNSPAMTVRMANAIAGAEAVVLPGLRHMGLAESPRKFNRPLVEFLSRNLLPTRDPSM